MSTPRDAIGYGRQFVDQDDVDAVVGVLRGERLTQGDAVPAFEESLVRATRAGHAVAVANGTVALELAYLALDVGRGSRVVTTANTFLATASAAVRTGAQVDFVDVDPHTWNLDVDELAALCAGPEAPDVVTVVHFAGLACDMQSVLDLKRRHGFRLIEDAAHALGARYVADGRAWEVGEHPEVDATTLSFHPVKLVTTGEGGAVLTHDAELAARLRRLREHGLDRLVPDLAPVPMVELGTNGRLSDLQAALGWSQLKKLPEFLAGRREIALRYVGELRDFELPTPGSAGNEHAWHLFCIHVDADERDGLRRHLAAHDIQTQVHYHPVPHQPWFRAFGCRGHWPHAEHHGRAALSLPIYPALSEHDQERVLSALTAWRRTRAAV